MSVLPPGETNSKVPPWATASRPVQPASRVASAIPANASRHKRMVKRPPARDTRGQPPFASPRVVPEPPTGQVQPQRPDRQLVADAHHLVAGAAGAGLLHGRRHPGRDLGVGLPPGRPERVAQLPPETRVPPGAVAGADAAP